MNRIYLLLAMWLLPIVGAFAQSINLTVEGPSGNLYVNEIYQGRKAPATISIPAGQSVRIGLGTNNGYYQRTVNRSQSGSVSMNNLETLPAKKFRIAVVPARRISHGGEIALLNSDDMDLVRATTQRTSEVEIERGTYGMLSWDVTVLPVVENVTLQRGGNSGDIPDMERFLRDANLTNLKTQYDAILLYYSVKKSNRSNVNNAPCCIWGNVGKMWISNGPVDRFTRDRSQYVGEGYTHEWLHGIENQSTRTVDGGLHSGQKHGYAKDQYGWPNWQGWYHDFMRGMVPKIPGSSEKTRFVGYFRTLKNWDRNPAEDSRPKTTNGSLANGTYTLRAKHSGKNLAVANGATANGANVIQANPTGGANQQWVVRGVGNGYYTLAARHSGKLLDVERGGTDNGANVLQWPNNGSNNQQWRAVRVSGNTYQLVARHSNKALDVVASKTNAGANVHQWNSHRRANQQWVFTAVSSNAVAERGLPNPGLAEPEEIALSQRSSPEGCDADDVSSALAQEPVAIEVFPNPVADLLQVETPDRSGTATVYNVVGKVVLTQRDNVNQIDVAELSPGVYFLRVNASEGVRFVKE